MFRVALIFVTSLVMAVSAAAQAGSWQIHPNHSSAQFAVRHLGVSTVRGAFTKVSGSAKYDPADPAKTTLEATIETSSGDTRVEMRDNDLRSPRFLDAQKFPTITFHSKQVKAGGQRKAADYRRPNDSWRDQRGGAEDNGPRHLPRLRIQSGASTVKRIGASASAKINRNDFGVSGLPGIVGDDLAITIDVELIQPKSVKSLR